MTEVVHQIDLARWHSPEPGVHLLCGRRDGDGPSDDGRQHFTTFNGRVTCLGCLNATTTVGQLELFGGAHG